MILDVYGKTNIQCLKCRCLFEVSSSVLYIECQKFCICLKKEIFDKYMVRGTKKSVNFRHTVRKKFYVSKMTQRINMFMG